jgi:RNA polymerase sigma-70 factor (ECF subfamily)
MIRQTLQFRQIVKEYSDRVALTAHGILRDKREAEEAVQDIFLKVYQGLRRFKSESEISTWIFRITVNVCISRQRGPRRPEISLDDPKILGQIADAASRPDELYEEAESKKRVAELTASLGDKESQALTLFYLDELDYNEISKIMNIPTGSVATVLHRGRAHLHYMMLRDMKEGL